MKIVSSVLQLKTALAGLKAERPGESVGFVPTMGYLHAGHVSLIERARRENGIVVLSIFVNPLQFGPNEDYERYPRDPERDAEMARKAGVDVLFMPAVADMYPKEPALRVTVGDMANRLCGVSRPGHFDGVATVLTKLFHMVAPDRAYFGMKDAQQVAVVRRLAEDFNFPLEIVACPTVREPDGLAMSSRNVYLSPEERGQAVVLSQALGMAERLLGDGEITANAVEHALSEQIKAEPLADIDYVSVLSYPSLLPLEGPVWHALEATGDRELIVALAVRFGKTRLIDNRVFWKTEGVLHHV
jgi:pantoate--beta-alanine ligase